MRNFLKRLHTLFTGYTLPKEALETIVADDFKKLDLTFNGKTVTLVKEERTDEPNTKRD